MTLVSDVAKRALDILASVVLLVVTAPMLVAAAAAVRLTLGTPVLFRQTRTGHHGALFTLFKLRTMRDARDERGRLLPDAERMSAVGRFLRRASIDELPELVNVLRGEMSLVGPRPLLPEYLSLYTARQARRHEVRPGITGWAQVNGRNALTWEQRFDLDVYYVDHRSLVLDLRILLRTFGTVLRRENVAHEGHVTMEPFRGNRT